MSLLDFALALLVAHKLKARVRMMTTGGEPWVEGSGVTRLDLDFPLGIVPDEQEQDTLIRGGWTRDGESNVRWTHDGTAGRPD